MSIRNIFVALSGRIFDGLASDNLLHFTLNTIYAQSSQPATTSLLIGYSLALYMIGISTSPFVAGLFQNFMISLLMAMVLFAFAIAYLQLCIPSRRGRGSESASGPNTKSVDLRNYSCATRRSVLEILKTFITPLKAFQKYPASLLCGMSLFTYNLVQSYAFSALLVHTSLRFGFTGKENGFVVTIAHSIVATYLFTVQYIVPRVFKPLLAPPISQKSVEYQPFLAMVSLVIQSISLLMVGLATRIWHIYIATVLLAVGLSTPSFIKAHAIEIFNGQQKNEMLAALATMEVMGDVLGPIAFSGWQVYDATGNSVFFGAAGTIAITFMLFVFGRILVRRGAGLLANEAPQNGDLHCNTDNDIRVSRDC